MLTPNLDSLGDGNMQQFGSIVLIIKFDIMDSDDENIETELSTSSGAASVLSKYKSNCFTSFFHPCFSPIAKDYPHQVNENKSALYNGNISDLWAFFNYNLKPQERALGTLNVKIFKYLGSLAQFSFLQRASKRIKDKKVREILVEATEKKFNSPFHEEKNDKIFDAVKTFYESSSFIEFLSEHEKEERIKIVENLKLLRKDPSSQAAILFYELMLKFILKKNKQNGKDVEKVVKRSQMMKLLIFHLNFTLFNTKWSEVCLSSKITSKMSILLLGEEKGILKMVKFYEDAPDTVLESEAKSFYHLFSM